MIKYKTGHNQHCKLHNIHISNKNHRTLGSSSSKSTYSVRERLGCENKCLYLVLFFQIASASSKMSWQLWIGPSNTTLNTLSKLLCQPSYSYVLSLIKISIENVNSQVVLLTDCTLAILARTIKFSYFMFKVAFQVIIVHKSLIKTLIQPMSCCL